jgi:hypothetical protein
LNPTPSEKDAAQTAPPPALVHRRGLNVSLETLRQGLQPIAQLNASDRNYFLFRNGQIRRQVGEGHSRLERGTRRLKRRADYASRRDYKRARNAEIVRDVLSRVEAKLPPLRASAAAAPVIFR